MSIFSTLFGNNATTSSQTQTLAPQAASLATNLFNRATDIANQPYQYYTDPRVADFTPDQQRAFDAARGISTTGTDLFNSLRGTIQGDLAARPTTQVGNLASRLDTATRGLARTLPNVDIQAYMNPYTEAVLQPAIGDINKQTAIERNRLNANAVRTGSFGGSRNMLGQQELQGNALREIGRLSANERSNAYNNAVTQFRQDQERIPATLMSGIRGYQAASDYNTGAYNALTNLLSANTGRLGTEVNTPLSIGGLQQALNQANLDTNYQRFNEARDWPLRGFNTLLSALGTGSGVLGTTTQSTQQGPQPNAVGQVLGATTGLLGSLGGLSGIGNLASGAWNTISNWFGSGNTGGDGGWSIDSYGGTPTVDYGPGGDATGLDLSPFGSFQF